MGKKGTSKGTKAKGKKDKNENEEPPPEPPKKEVEEEEIEVKIEDWRNIKVTIESYQNFTPVYPYSNIYSTCHFLEQLIGESEKIVVSDEPILVANQEFVFACDVNSTRDLDHLIAQPVILTLHQAPFPHGSSLVVDVANSTRDFTVAEAISLESTVSLYEALTGDIVEKVEVEKESEKKKKGKKDKGRASKVSMKGAKSKKSKSSKDKSTKSSKKTKSSKDSSVKIDDIASLETTLGVCSVDLLPLILGQESFTEFIPIKMLESFCDDRMITFKNNPGLVVNVSIEKPLAFPCITCGLMLTMESIFNIPTSILKSDMNYQICVKLPIADSPVQTILIGNGKYETAPVGREHKKWPEFNKEIEQANITKYKMDYDVTNIITNVPNLNLEETFKRETPRVEYNSLKRVLLLKEGFYAFYDQVKNHRRILLEFHIFPKQDEPKSATDLASPSRSSAGKKSTKGKGGKDKGKKDSKVAVEEEPVEKSSGFLHLMAVVDVVPLLYPGVTKVRTACQLTTYHTKEALILAGVKKSYFFPEPEPVAVPPAPVDVGVKKKEKGGKDKGGKSSSKGSKGSSKKSKGSKKSGKSEEPKTEANLKDLLPPPPVIEPEPEPSVKVFDELGNPTFIVVEIELTQPLIEKIPVEDLHASLDELINPKPAEPKIVQHENFTEDYYKTIIKELINDVNVQYNAYLDERRHCRCENPADFLTYLRRIGAYQIYVYTLIKIASMQAKRKLHSAIEAGTDIPTDVDNKLRDRFAEEIFVNLVADVREVLHKTTTVSGALPRSKTASNVLLFYAKEAVEVGDYKLAARYYLERLSFSDSDPNPWFDYAIFELERGETYKSSACLQEALSRNTYHCYGLLLYGLFLTDKKELDSAEVCLLTLMIHEPRWLEGWTLLYVFYEKLERVDGMELAKEMALKYLDDPRSFKDYFSAEGSDLAWTSSICPNTMYFRLAVLLIKMRMFDWAENVLSHELRHPDVLQYCLAVICYYKKCYDHALEHLEKAKFIHGSDHAVTSLCGHVYLAKGNNEAARTEYMHILESYDKPQDLYMIYFNCAQAEEKLGNTQQARKLLLLCCKMNPTPRSWLLCGIYYYKQQDLLSAEECLSESTLLDNKLAESWGYLTLINLKLAHNSEADLCFQLALRNGISENESLMEQIEKEVFNLSRRPVKRCST